MKMIQRILAGLALLALVALSAQAQISVRPSGVKSYTFDVTGTNAFIPGLTTNLTPGVTLDVEAFNTFWVQVSGNATNYGTPQVASAVTFRFVAGDGTLFKCLSASNVLETADRYDVVLPTATVTNLMVVQTNFTDVPHPQLKLAAIMCASTSSVTTVSIKYGGKVPTQ